MESKKEPLDTKSSMKAVEEWIQTQGYPLEFHAANAFRDAGFSIAQSLYVQDIDSDASKVREVDVTATIQNSTPPIPISISHVVECKYTQNKPWVIFSCQENKLDPEVYVKQCIASSWGPRLLDQIAHDPEIQQLGVFSGFERSGFNMRQAHSKNNDLDICYSSLQSVVGAAEGLSNYYTQLDTAKACAAIVFPVIVVDGSLFECFLEQTSKNLMVQEVKHIQVHWRGSLRRRAITTVDIVTKSYSEEFAKLAYSQSRKLSDKFVSAASEYFSRITRRRKPAR